MNICLKCQKQYRTVKSGVIVNELANFGSYKLWSADIRECPVCRHQIISGFAKDSFSEHFMEGHNEAVIKAKELGILYDWKE